MAPRPVLTVRFASRYGPRGLAASALVLLSASIASAVDPVPTPTVEATPPGAIFNDSPVDLAPLGFVQEEFFFSGTTAQGGYKSRMIVRRPLHPADFNGTVVVEWMNASAGNDLDVDFLTMLPLMQEHGYAYVAVSAQQVTVEFLRDFAPFQPRYASLFMDELQPSQPAAFEVFAQAGQALRNNGTGVDPMGGLQVERLIAIGQSQSSGRLTTMVSSIHGVVLEGVYDGYVPHAGGGPPTAFPVPVFKVNSENEAPGYFDDRGVADPNYRYWEVPGTSHSPLEGNQYSIDILTFVRGFFPICPFPYQGPGGPAGIDPVLRAAVHYLDDWILTGTPPPVAPLIDMLPDGGDPELGVIQRDSFGNALGGIRLPQMEVPTGRNTPSYGCLIEFPPFGTIVLATFPQWDAFDGDDDPAVDPTDVYAPEPASPRAVYRNHGGYVSRFVRATDAVEAAGFILDFDADRLRREAARSQIAK